MIRLITKEEDQISCLKLTDSLIFYAVKDRVKCLNLNDLSPVCELIDHKGFVTYLDIYQHKNEYVLLSGSKDKTVKAWSLNDFKCSHTFSGHKDSIVCAVKKGDILFTASKDCTIRIWEFATTRCIYQIKLESAPDSLFIHPTLNTIYTNTNNGSVYSIHLKSKTNGQKSIFNIDFYDFNQFDVIKEDIFSSSVTCIALSETSNILYSGWEDKTIRLFNVETSSSMQVLLGHSQQPKKIVVLRDNIISSSNDDIILWNKKGDDITISANLHKSIMSDTFSVSFIKNNGYMIYMISNDRLSIHEMGINDYIQESVKKDIEFKLNKENLNTLNIENYLFKYFPDFNVNDKNKLEILNISNNIIKTLPDDLDLYRNIKEMYINNNLIKNMHANVSNLRQLSKVDMSYNKFDTFPTPLLSIISISYIDMKNNNIEELPRSISNLINLVHLDVSNNNLKSLSYGLYKLKKLTYFNISNNNFNATKKVKKETKKERKKTRPRRGSTTSMIETKKIKTDKLSQSVKSDNEGVRKDKSRTNRSQSYRPSKIKIVKENGIDFDRIDVYQFNFQKLEMLTHLDLSSNKLTNIPKSICKLRRLLVLQIQDNSINNIPDELFDIETLQLLNISSNLIETIPESISSLRKLREFYIQKNNIAQLPNAILRLTNLEIFNVSGNSLEHLPFDFGLLFNLKDLDISNNRFKEFPLDLTSLDELTNLNISNNMISTIPFEVIYLTKLKVFNASSNKIKDVPFECLRNIEKLNLSFNEITHLSKSVSTMCTLKHFNLSHNSIKKLTPYICSLESLEYLDISYNEIKSILPYLTFMDKLRYLNIEGNHIDINIKNPNSKSTIKQQKKSIKQDKQSSDVQIPPPSNLSAESQLNELFDGYSGHSRISYATQISFCGLEGSGKSTLYHRLKYGKAFKKPKPTRGIHFDEWNTKILSNINGKIKNSKTTILVKDFSGANNIRIMHRLFMSENSVYIVVWNLILDEQRSDLPFWINTIMSYAPNSPILIVGTHLDSLQNDVNAPIIGYLRNKYMSKEYPNVVDIIPVSCLNGTNIDVLWKSINNLILKKTSYGKKIPISFHKLASSLSKEISQNATPIIENNEFKKIMMKYNIEKQNYFAAIQYLNSIGKIINLDTNVYEDFSAVVVDPPKMADIIYKLISFKNMENGYLKHELLENVWKNTSSPYHYSFISMIHRLEIAVDNGSDFKTSRNFYANISIIPSLLSDLENNENSIWQKTKENEIVKIYKLGFIPSDFISKMVSRGSKNMRQIELWKNGCIFKALKESVESDTENKEDQISKVEVYKDGTRIKISTRGVNMYSFHKKVTGIADGIIKSWRTPECKASSYVVSYYNNEPRLFSVQKIENEQKWGRKSLTYKDNLTINIEELLRESHTESIPEIKKKTPRKKY